MYACENADFISMVVTVSRLQQENVDCANSYVLSAECSHSLLTHSPSSTYILQIIFGIDAFNPFKA